MVWLLISILCGGCTAAIASVKGRNAIGWFFVGFFLGILGPIIAAVMPDLKAQQQAREHLERENRRLQERLKQEQVKNEAFRRHATKRLDIHDEHLAIDTRQAGPLALPDRDGALPAEQAAGVATAVQTQTGSVPLPPVPRRRAWHYSNAGETVGPIAEAELANRLGMGELDASTLVWCAELDDWKEAREVALLQRYLPPSG